MQEYKGMFIIRPDQTEDQIKAIIEDVKKGFTEHNGEITSVDEWGMRQLAYEIDDLKKGYYVLFIANADSEAIEEFNRIANIREDIMRHIIVRN